MTSAAQQVADQCGWGPCTLVRVSSAGAFVAGAAFLRVVHEYNDPAGTMQVARVLADALGCARPLLAGPVEVRVGDEVLWVEAYERLAITSDAKPSHFEHGVCLAQLHQVDAHGEQVRRSHRLAASRARLVGAPAEVRDELEPLFARAEAALDASSGPLVVCHGDQSRENIVDVGGRWVWTDLEYAGLAPASLDVAMAVADAVRFAGRDGAREVVAGYCAGGGEVDMADVVVLAGIRELCGVADYASRTAGWTFKLRYETMGELFRDTRWGVA